ncbi:uncharacterized protein [Venturia canescens]|uniref:uncharacterized protein isoform X2 n=1 Tax=Venturia canescens TaxID=32260 RepID=UPI001C9C5C99|nr:uncharacterized protein LOC122418481 isoform X2 [Venturia canescens]
MKFAVILGLFFAVAFAEKKIDLEDIERDNLRAESKSDTENINSQDSSYSVPSTKPDKTESKYQQGTRQYQNNDDVSSYVTPQQLQDKYSMPSEGYQQDIKYSSDNDDYQRSSQPIRYVEYPQQVETTAPKSISQTSAYAAPPQQQLYYQPEVSVGNHYQSVQQKTASHKFAKNSNKETLYVNIPMAQLLSYYPHIAGPQPLVSKGHGNPGLHGLLNQPDQQVVIPFYMAPLTRDPVYSNSKITYQIQPQYTPHSSTKFPLLTEAILPTRPPSKLIYSQPLLNQRQSQPQSHHLQEIVYTQQPGALTYVPIGSSHDSSLYDRPSTAHLDSNTLNQNYESQTGHAQTYAPYEHQSVTKYEISNGNYAPHGSNQIYQQHGNENVHQNYESVPEAPDTGLDLPRLPAKDFKSSDSHYTQNQLVHSEEPRSLLDSYIPSNILAAQNSERYRERPIRLERGFLPSKVTYVQSYKKRKIQ